MPLDVSQLQPVAPSPTPAVPPQRGLDLGALQPPAPTGGMDVGVLQHNPNLDTEDRLPGSQYLRNVIHTLASGVSPITNWMGMQAKGFSEASGMMLQGAANLPNVLGKGLSVVPGGLALQHDGDLLKSLGQQMQSFGQLKEGDSGNWLSRDLPHAIGGAVPYVLGGMATGGSSVLPTSLGMVHMGESLYQDAKTSGATEDDARLAYLAGAAIGSADALPLSYLFRNLNKLTGGGTYEIAKRLSPGMGVKDFIAGQGASVAGQMLRGFTVEGLTEAGQELAANWVARDLIGYDPHRDLKENVWDNFVTGGAVGSLLMGATGMLQRSARQDAERELKRVFDSLSQDPINAIAGKFTPIGDVLKLRGSEQDVTAYLIERGKEFTATTSEVPDSFVLKENQLPHHMPGGDEIQSIFDAHLAGIPIEPSIEKVLTKDNPNMVLGDAIQKTPVVALRVEPYRHQIQELNDLIAAREKRIAEGKHVSELERLTLPRMKELREALLRKTELAKIWVRHMKDYTAKFVDVLGDGTRFVISDFSFTERGPEGRMAFLREVIDINGKPTTVIYIDIALDKLATARYNEEKLGKGWYSTEESRKERRNLFEVLNHELGHYLISKRLYDILQEGVLGNEDSKNIFAAVASDYYKWLDRQFRGPINEYLQHVATPGYSGGLTNQLTPNAPGTMVDPQVRDYLFSFDEYFAQQTARLATQGKLAGDPSGIMTKFFNPLLEQYQKIFAELPHLAKNEFGGNFEKFIERFSLQHKISQGIQKAIAGGAKSLYDVLKGLPGFDPENFAGHQDHLDRWNIIREYGYNLLQIAKDQPHIEGVQKYVGITRNWAAYARAIDARAVETIKEWRSLGKKGRDAVGQVLLEETSENRRLDAEELQKRLPTLEMQKVYAQIRADFDFALDEMEKLSIENAKKNFIQEGAENQTKLQEEIKEIQTSFDKLRAGGYFPYMRFGKWIITVRAAQDTVIDGVPYKKGEIVSYESFDRRGERDSALHAMQSMQGKDRNLAISPSIMKESGFVVQGLPSAMLRTMKDRIPNLTPEQRTAIDEALQDLAPFKGLRKQFLRRRGVQGFSMDFMRSYAMYMKMLAGHAPRVRYADDFQAAIEQVDGDVRTLSYLGRDSTKRQMIANWMKKHHDYIMDPASEWTGLRSAIFFFYLGYHVKSAFVNLTQIPLITYPYLSARYGSLLTARELTTASAMTTSYWKNRKKWTDADPESARGRIVRLLAQGQKDGFIDQALATELAIAASEGNIQRTLASGLKKVWLRVSEAGAKPFAVAEKFNRTVTAIAAYNLEYSKTKNHDIAYTAARDAVESTQYENSRWNRPRYQRGKFGTAFVFTGYIQNTLYFMLGGDKGAARSVMMLLLLSGLMGFPGAENAEDLIDWSATWVRELFGAKDPKFAMRQELREMLEELNLNPDLALHGLGQSSFGMAAIGQMTGVPIPEFDLSGSIGLGQIVPGTEMLRGSAEGGSQMIGSAATAAAGAGGAAFDSILQGIWGNSPDSWKRAEKTMPRFAKSISQGTRYLVRGEESTDRGDVIAEFDPYDPKDFLEITGQMLGFTPTKVTKGWDKLIAEREAVQYYTLRREGLMKAHNWAFYHKDEDAARDVRQRIKEFNEVVPYPELGITSDALNTSLKQYVEGQIRASKGIDAQRRNIRLRQSISSAYIDQPASDN